MSRIFAACAIAVVIALTGSAWVFGSGTAQTAGGSKLVVPVNGPAAAPDPSVVFVAPSCPPGAHWGVHLGFVTKVGNGPGPLVFPVNFGTYPWSLVPPQPSNFSLSPTSGSVTLSPLAGPATVTVTLVCTAASGVVNLLGTPVTSPSGVVIGSLNVSTARPWGETYDPVNGCLYVTEDPMTSPATQGFLTSFGPFQPPTSVLIPGGLDPQGIAWAGVYYGEPAPWTAQFRDGFVMIADTGSNSVSLFGLGIPGAVTCHPTFLGTLPFVPNWATGGLLTNPWDVVFDLHTRLFYVTWSMASGVVQAFSGLSPGCQFLSGTVAPLGLSTDAHGVLEVANGGVNGWVTGLVATPVLDAAAGICTGAMTVSASELSDPTFTAFAPVVVGNGSGRVVNVVAATDASYGNPGDLIGPGLPPGCVVGTPTDHQMAELKDGTLVCLNSVSLDAATPPPTNPGAYGIAFNGYTHHFLVVLNSQGEVEAADYTFAFPGIPVAPAASFESVEVVWFVPAAAFVAPYYFNAPVGDGTMAVTNWAAGTVYLGAAV